MTDPVSPVRPVPCFYYFVLSRTAKYIVTSPSRSRPERDEFKEMTADLNVGHYRCEEFRVAATRLFRPLHRPHSRSSPFFFLAPEPLVILFPRRFSSPNFASGVGGFLSEISTVRLTSLPSSFHFPPPSFRPTGSLSLSPRKRIWKWGGGDGPYESFGPVLLLFYLPPGE